MNVFINAISITEGGGVVVLTRLIEAMSKTTPGIMWYIASSEKTLAFLPENNQIVCLPYSWARKTPFHHLYWYEIELPRLIRRFKIDLCFSHTNFLSRRRLSCPSLLLIHNAGYFSDKFTQLHLQCYSKYKDAFLWKIKNKWAFDSIKRATMVTVQTKALADKIIARLRIPAEKIATIPHGLGLLNESQSQPRDFPKEMIWRIGYVTKFGVQKDFHTAIKAISRLKKMGLSVKLILTLNPNIPEYATICEQIRQNNIEDCVENKGDMVNADEIKQLYDSLHLFIFPSIIESFGFTLVEAMASGLPVIAADTESNREIMGVTGIFFAVEDEKSLADNIHVLINSQTLYIDASQKNLEKSHEYCWKITARSLAKIFAKYESNASVGFPR